MARVFLNAKNLQKHWWAEVVNIAMYAINKMYLRPHTTKDNI